MADVIFIVLICILTPPLVELIVTYRIIWQIHKKQSPSFSSVFWAQETETDVQHKFPTLKSSSFQGRENKLS